MIHLIEEVYSKTDFDFRQWANPEDGLSYLFPDWVDYYRLKYSIAKAIAPRSICEIGVRFGYSAITFLSACPHATYLGIDNNSANFGGVLNAVKWAESILHGYQYEIVIADSQKLSSLPGGPYDLVHVDGQQDGEGTFHDLELALEKGTWILVDGFFWKELNLQSCSYFMKKYRHLIEYATIIPGYAGELLIRLNGSAPRRTALSRRHTNAQLAQEYDKKYFFGSCSGYNTFRKHGGQELTEPHLTLSYLCEPEPGKSILDVGCGRGELSYALAKSGAKVISIDYSKSAIEIAQDTFGESCARSHFDLSFYCMDVLRFETDLKFDAIVMADFVEHIEEDELVRVLVRIKSLLKAEGRLILHTAPNLEHYRRGYARRVELARSVGLFLPSNPRSHYADLMHINEQTPSSLEAILASQFPAVRVWIAYPDRIGSLREGLNEDNLCRGNSIFAVAALSPIEDMHLISALSKDSAFLVDRLPYNVSFRCENADLGKLLSSSGFSKPEPWGTWSAAREVSLQFNFSDQVPVAATISLLFRALATPDHPQSFEFLWNSKTLGKTLCTGFAECRQRYDVSSLMHKKNILTIKVPDAVTPQSLGINQDTRLLGIGMTSIELARK